MLVRVLHVQQDHLLIRQDSRHALNVRLVSTLLEDRLHVLIVTQGSILYQVIFIDKTQDRVLIVALERIQQQVLVRVPLVQLAPTIHYPESPLAFNVWLVNILLEEQLHVPIVPQESILWQVIFIDKTQDHVPIVLLDRIQQQVLVRVLHVRPALTILRPDSLRAPNVRQVRLLPLGRLNVVILILILAIIIFISL